MSLNLITTGGGWDRSCGSRPQRESTGSGAKTGLGSFLALLLPSWGTAVSNLFALTFLSCKMGIPSSVAWENEARTCFVS